MIKTIVKFIFEIKITTHWTPDWSDCHVTIVSYVVSTSKTKFHVNHHSRVDFTFSTPKPVVLAEGLTG